MHPIGRVTTIALCAVLALGACSRKTKEVRPAAAQKVAVTAAEFSLTGVPASLKAGLVEITLTNTGKEHHEFQLIRVDGSLDVVKKFFSDLASEGEGIPIPKDLKDGGGIAEIPPGKTAASTNVVSAGTWVYVCAVTDEKTKKSHSDLGMFGTFTVSGISDARLPATDASVSAAEYSFTTAGLKAGTNKVTFRNTGAEIHHFGIAPLAPGKTIADVKAVFASQEPPSGPPPVDFEKIQFAAALDAGKAQVLSLDLAAGKYALVCFINDRAGGPPHVAKGMIAEVTIA